MFIYKVILDVLWQCNTLLNNIFTVTIMGLAAAIINRQSVKACHMGVMILYDQCRGLMAKTGVVIIQRV